ncbi:hypothetical protein [Sphingomonas sp. Leaf37]|uniref:hypothetical protein n=1 Tax=Sphingomonas sp. Leaf37 TaxID=2876552 RepID=UPI001E348562|nr:hypothetical protein [Sphingomonas sp. Leaf37]
MDLPLFRFIEPDVGVYLYYAGRDRKYMRISQAESAIFLDLPGLATDPDTFSTEGTMTRALNRADATKRYLRDPTSNPRPLATTSYSENVPEVDGRLNQSFIADLSNLRTMFVDMKVGDVVIMTPSNHYDPLLIGEVKTRWNDNEVLHLPEQGENAVPYRSVNWLSHSLSRRDFPVQVARRLQNRKAITRIDETYYESIFRFLYHAYVWGNISKLDIFGPQYNSNDPTATAEASFIVKYAIAYYSAFAKGEVDLFNDLSLEDAADAYFDPEIALQVAQAFGSPGGYVAKLIGSGAAIAVAMVIATTLSSEANDPAAVHQQVTAQATEVTSGHRFDVGIDLSALGNSFRAGKTAEIRVKYGRPARAKLGMTLHGNRAPELSATQRVVR